MAREHANIRNDIWNDDDFRRLSSSAQLLYLQLLTSATLTYAGVADWRPKRIAALSNGRAADDVEAAAGELDAGLFIVIDEDTEEVLVRSFLKHDGLMQKPNVAKAMVTAHGKVTSLMLKAVIVHEVKRLRKQFPEWRAFVAGVVDELCEKDSLDPAERVRERVPETLPGRDAPLLTTNYLLPATGYLATNSASPTLDLEALFDSAYSHWPKKTERKKSFEKFKQLSRKRDPLELAAYVARFGDAYTETTEVQFVPALNVWLNGERWTDALPQRSTSRTAEPSRSEAANDFVQRLEAIDESRGNREAPGNRRELR